MHREDDELQSILEPARMSTESNADHMQAVRQRMLHQARASLAHPHRAAVRWTVGLLAVVAVSAGGLAATRAGRDFIRRVFTPVETSYSFQGEVQSKDGNYELWSAGRSGFGVGPYTSQEGERLRARWAEMRAIGQEGGGRLTGLIESTQQDGTGYSVIYLIDYALSDGSVEQAGSGRLTSKQARNMRIDEILKFRDAGAGEVIDARASDLGLGRFLIRFTLSDGSMVDLTTQYPPGTRTQREAIFAEALELRRRRDFAVLLPHRDATTGTVTGVMKFTLADGRTVGLVGSVPTDMLTPDGKHVATLDSEPSPASDEEDERHRSEMAEARQIAMDGGGKLVVLDETPILGGAGYRVSYLIEYVLSSGETLPVGTSSLTEQQAANMRIDELLALRDAGAGEIVKGLPSRLPLGLGSFLIRFELSDGSTVDVETHYPPGTRAEREAIFAEALELRRKGEFTVFKPEGEPEPRSGSQLLVFTLADGRKVGISGFVPPETLTPDDGVPAPDNAEDHGQ